MEDISKRGEVWHSKLLRVLNSTFCFTFIYVLINYLQWFVMAFTSKIFEFDTIVYTYGVKYLLNGLAWNRLNISIIFGSGVFYFVLFGLLGIYLFSLLKQVKSVLNLLFIWAFVTGTSLFCTQALVGALGNSEYNSPYYQNLSIVYSWWRIPDVIAYFFVIPAAILFIYFSVNQAKPFLLLAYSYTKVNKLERRRKYFFETAIVPVILGCMLVLVYKYATHTIYDLYIQLLYMATIFLGLIFSYIALPKIDVQKDEVIKYKSLQSFTPVPAILLVLLWAVIYLTRYGVYLSFN